MTKISYAGYRFPAEIIHQAIWLYLRFTLSFRDVEDLLAERGIAVSYETVRRWVNYFGGLCHVAVREREVSALRSCQAEATAVRHVVIATVRSARCVWAEMRWRWTLKVLKTAACVERNFWAEPGLLNRCILRSRRRVG